jgi:hypothetical protein
MKDLSDGQETNNVNLFQRQRHFKETLLQITSVELLTSAFRYEIISFRNQMQEVVLLIPRRLYSLCTCVVFHERLQLFFDKRHFKETLLQITSVDGEK